jgi:RNA-binding protein 39
MDREKGSERNKDMR